jgi:hypothetical protein
MVVNPLTDITAPEDLVDPLELMVVTQDHSMEGLVIRLPALIPDIQLLALAALLLILREE